MTLLYLAVSALVPQAIAVDLFVGVGSLPTSNHVRNVVVSQKAGLAEGLRLISLDNGLKVCLDNDDSGLVEHRSNATLFERCSSSLGDRGILDGAAIGEKSAAHLARAFANYGPMDLTKADVHVKLEYKVELDGKKFEIDQNVDFRTQREVPRAPYVDVEGRNPLLSLGTNERFVIFPNSIKAPRERGEIAAKALEEYEKIYLAERELAVTQLRKLIEVCRSTYKNDFLYPSTGRGLKVNELNASVKDRLLRMMRGDFKSYGFSSADEAERAFLRSSSLSILPTMSFGVIARNPDGSTTKCYVAFPVPTAGTVIKP